MVVIVCTDAILEGLDGAKSKAAAAAALVAHLRDAQAVREGRPRVVGVGRHEARGALFGGEAVLKGQQRAREVFRAEQDVLVRNLGAPRGLFEEWGDVVQCCLCV